jgi:trehalose-6-phosphate synthase
VEETESEEKITPLAYRINGAYGEVLWMQPD